MKAAEGGVDGKDMESGGTTTPQVEPGKEKTPPSIEALERAVQDEK